MKILVVHSRYRSTAPSGENRVVDEEADMLRSAGHEVEAFEANSDAIATWPIWRKAALPVTSVRDTGVRHALEHRLDLMNPDVVHVHNTFPLLSASVLHACRNARVPVVATLHNYKLLCPGGDFFRDGSVCHECAGGSMWPALRSGCYRGSRLATAPVAVGNAINRSSWRELVSAYLFISAAQRNLMQALALPEDRVFVKHNFVRAPHEVAADRDHTVVYLGRLDAAKGVPFLMRAWDAFRVRFPDAALRLSIAGGGPLEDEVRRWAAGHPSVDVAGLLSPNEAREFLGRALVAVVPSQWQETFGLVAVEAMSAAVAPVASARGSFPELITDGVDGVLFDPTDPSSLAAVFRNVDREPDRYLEIGRQGRTSAKKRFDPVSNIEELLQIYRFAIENPRIGTGAGAMTTGGSTLPERTET